MWTPWNNRTEPQKRIAILTVVLLISSGLCGLQYVYWSDLYNLGDWGFFFFASLGILELLVIVTMFIWIINTLMDSEK